MQESHASLNSAWPDKFTFTDPAGGCIINAMRFKVRDDDAGTSQGLGTAVQTGLSGMSVDATVSGGAFEAIIERTA